MVKNYIPLAFFLLVFIHLFLSLIKITTTIAPDFSVFYYAAQSLLHQVNPYLNKELFTVFNYPPITLIFFVPLAILPYYVAQSLFIMVSFLLIFIIIRLSFKVLNVPFSNNVFLLVCAFALLSFPVKFTLGMGQINFYAYALLLGSLLFYLHFKKAFVSSLMFILAILLKPVLLVMIVYFIIKKDYEWLIYFVLFLTLIVGVFYLTSYSRLMDYYIHYVMPQLSSLAGREIYYNQSMSGFISRMVPADLGLRSHLFTFVSVFIFLISLIFAYGKKVTDPVKISIFLTMLVIINPLSWQHHFVFLILPFMTGLYLSKNKWDIILLAVAYILVSVNIKNPEPLYKDIRVLLLSHTLYGALILEYLLIKNRLVKIKKLFITK